MIPAMRNAVVITTIHPPGKATLAFGRLPGWRLVVAADRKTPDGWRQAGCRFIAEKDQRALSYGICKQLPWNHYSRKMIGYLVAIETGAHRIADSDDDNIPLENWGFPDFDGSYETTAPDRGFVNVYGLFSQERPSPWPRGFPLNRLLPEPVEVEKTSVKTVQVGVWQGLVKGEADVDAIYRLTVNRPIRFTHRAPIVFDTGTPCPFNSQNTVFRRALFPLLYLPAFVTFRYTDILRSLVAQPVMWASGYRLGFISPTVIQERNPHNLLADFESEIPCYLHPEKVTDAVQAAVRSGVSISENLLAAYEALARKELVRPEEMNLLEAWIGDIHRLGVS